MKGCSLCYRNAYLPKRRIEIRGSYYRYSSLKYHMKFILVYADVPLQKGKLYQPLYFPTGRQVQGYCKRLSRCVRKGR